MEVTEIRISRRTQGDGKLKGYAAVTFDDVFVVRDLKIIEGKKGLFVAMPSQKIQAPCPQCKKKNALRSRFCNECGHKLPVRDKSRREVHRDIAHPVNSEMRAYLQKIIIEAFQANDGDVEEDSLEVSEEYEETVPEETPAKSIDTPDTAPDTAPDSPDDYLSTPSLDEDERRPRDEDDSTRELLDTIE